jgi:hypothetical protein
MEDLVQLDIREGEEYQRTRVSLRSVHTVPFLGTDYYQSQLNTVGGGGADHYRAIWQARQTELKRATTATRSTDQQISAVVTVWVYEQVVPDCPGPDHPIAQSYLDIILRGCLDISLDFATGFLQRVQGWSMLLQQPQVDTDHSPNEDVLDAPQTAVEIAITRPPLHHLCSRDWYFVNDRRAPVYIRSDSEWSHHQAKMLDALIETHQPMAMMHRTSI